MANTIGILLFDGAEEMDFVGPWEVLTAAVDGLADERVMTIAEKPGTVVCEKGMRVIPDATYADAPDVNVIIVPGGSGARREIDNPETVEWLTQTCAKCSWVTSVCTGAFLLVGTGIVRGRRMTTHHDFVQALGIWVVPKLSGAFASCATATSFRRPALCRASRCHSGWQVGSTETTSSCELRTISPMTFRHEPRQKALAANHSRWRGEQTPVQDIAYECAA